MGKWPVAIVRYEKPLESLRTAVELCHGLDHLPPHPRVFIKPNIVFWTQKTDFPKWGVLTTSRVVEDTVILLKERGVDDIAIVEGTIVFDFKDTATIPHAYETLGYNKLKQRYGVQLLNAFERPFEKVDLGEGVSLRFNADVLHGDFFINIPVLKTHAQTTVSLGIKNLKGLLDLASRKKCHSMDPQKDLNFMIARLPGKLPSSLTIMDGIFTLERGPSFDGKARRSNLLVVSPDYLSADMVGAKVLGYGPSEVAHLVQAARNRSRPCDLSDVIVMGERIEDVASWHESTFQYNEDGSLPISMAKMGIKGLYYWKYDLSMCTYCSQVNGVTLAAIARAWKGEPWHEVEVLTGKAMKPSPGKKKTILIGKCMYHAHKDCADGREMIAVKGCPPSPKAVVSALHKAGIEVEPMLFEQLEALPGFFMRKYEGRPEFEESLFKVA